jgi:hypothetical protein
MAGKKPTYAEREKRAARLEQRLDDLKPASAARPDKAPRRNDPGGQSLRPAQAICAFRARWEA